MIVAVPMETRPGEKRVSLSPEAVKRLLKMGLEVRVQAGAGTAAGYVDEAYKGAGAEIAPDSKSLLDKANLIVKVARPTDDELDAYPAGSALIAFLFPLGDPAFVKKLADHKITALSMDAIPRISRAQGMDALSSQSNIAGYKAVLLAATALPKFFPMLTTAAGTIAPAKVLIIGAGVAGLQAIATARRLGAVVSAYDTRPAVKEQVESLGAKFLEIPVGEQGEGTGGYARELSADAAARQRAFLTENAKSFDVIVSTALVPGRPAPLLLEAGAVHNMNPGSVIVDLAAETGGNCALTKAGETIQQDGVTIIGTTNLPSTVPLHASQLYARNVCALLDLLVKDKTLALDFDDEITRDTCLTHDGRILHKPTLEAEAKAKGATS